MTQATLFDAAARDRILRRIDLLRADAPRQWGKMEVAQALAHCSLALEAATGDRPMKQVFIGKVLGPFFRNAMIGPKPFSRNSPTSPLLIVSTPQDFERERARIVALVRRFHDAGPDAAGRQIHGFLGRVSGDEWGRLQYKHVDHHLTQFGAV